ncbi:MAG: TrbC/VirB2 family protein [Alphaproteobacteria bacterium]|nr:TrbC/VirB2 family protein [Alphaproteobacteria bacterium]
MKLLKNNICTILTLVLFFTLVMTGNAEADVFGTAQSKLSNLFKQSKFVIFLIGGFGLIALAFQAIFGKLKWAWFAALAFGLAVVAAAGGVVGYAANQDNIVSSNFSDSLK